MGYGQCLLHSLMVVGSLLGTILGTTLTTKGTSMSTVRGRLFRPILTELI